MRTPLFWYQRPGLLARALTPVGWLYAAATARRVRRGAQGYRAPCPVICIGNINAGGTGKTPTAMALAGILTGKGHKVMILTRGYGGALTGPVVVNPTTHCAANVGDEPLLLAGFAPTVVAKDRAAGARMIGDMGADVILMDDGFQSPAVIKDLSIVVVDAARGFGNGLCIPAGPLREPVVAGLARADMLLTIGDQAAQNRVTRNMPPSADLPRLQAALQPLPTGMPWQGMRAYAFAGIGHPEKFFQTLRTAGVNLCGAVGLGDHDPISRTLFERLAKQARDANAQLVTTEKDAVRLPPDLRGQVLPFPVRLTWQDGDGAALDAALNHLGL
ncbi:MAG: tetraacyldisaccharide 4'-kinase [Pseudomonadota bacterium]